MTSWSGIVLALPVAGREEMASRIPAYLHPVAGRPLIWHTVSALVAVHPRPERVLVVSDVELPEQLFQDVAAEVEVLPPLPDGDLSRLEDQLDLPADQPLLMLPGTALADPAELTALVGHAEPRWLAGPEEEAVAAWVVAAARGPLLRLPEPFSTPNGVLADPQRLPSSSTGLVVRSRADLSLVTRTIRDRLVRQLMRGGVTFLLPDSVMVDVDVRIGRDSVVYPGVVLEGQTTVGDETVIGPGCRIISSWVGSGVELKGWNYLAHTSIRNRAILEPYVRRGYD